MTSCRTPYRFLGCLFATIGSLTSPLIAQTSARRGPEPASALVAVFPASLYNDQANVREASDSAAAGIATTALRRRFQEQLGAQLVPFPAVDSVRDTPGASGLAGGVACNVRVACAVGVARSLDARWVVLAKVSKTSNLIWLLTGQLVNAATGEIVIDDSTELKGDPEPMVRAGTRIFAERVARTIEERTVSARAGRP